MRLLHDGGYGISAGVLNVLDSDYENANDLHIPVAAEIPFSQISPEAHAENLRLIDESPAVVVCPFPVGPGNFRNLEAARHALDSGKRVLIVRPATGQGIDFVGGKADSTIKELISSGAIEVPGEQQLLSQLSEIGR